MADDSNEMFVDESIESEILERDIEEEATETQPGNEDGKPNSSKIAQLPYTRVRNMMKLDTDLHIASQESVFLVTKAAEYFVQFIAKEAHRRSIQSKRKTIQKRDLDAAINEIDSMVFLEGEIASYAILLWLLPGWQITSIK
eukprot:gene8239-9121_t